MGHNIDREAHGLALDGSMHIRRRMDPDRHDRGKVDSAAQFADGSNVRVHKKSTVCASACRHVHQLFPTSPDRLADTAGPLDRASIYDIAAIADATRRDGEAVNPGGIEDLTVAVDQNAIVVKPKGAVSALLLPHARDDLLSVEDVAQPEDYRGIGMRLLERFQSRYQLTLSATRHVVDQDHIGPVMHERVPQQVGSPTLQSGRFNLKNSRLPLPYIDLSDRWELHVIHSTGKLEKRAGGRIHEQENVSVLALFEKAPSDQRVSPQMPETQTVL